MKLIKFTPKEGMVLDAVLLDSRKETNLFDNISIDSYYIYCQNRLVRKDKMYNLISGECFGSHMEILCEYCVMPDAEILLTSISK